jgi:hypothetical protein
MTITVNDEPVYTTVDDVKAYLGITTSNFDDELTADIATAARWIDENCDQIFYETTDEETRSFIPQNPGYCITDPISEFVALTAQESIWTLDQDFILEPLNAALQGRPFTAIRTIARPFIFTLSQIPAGWAGFDGRVYVTAKFGWPAVPNQIVQANKIQAARYFHRRNAPLGVISFSNEVAFRMAGADADAANLLEAFGLVSLF